MNPIFRSLDSLMLNINDFESRIKYYQDNIYDNVYFVGNNNGKLLGYQNYENECIEKNPDMTYCMQEDAVTTESINQCFMVNPSLRRLPIVRGNILIGEYYDADSVGMLLYRKIERQAMTLINVFRNQVNNYLQNKRIRVFGDASSLNISGIALSNSLNRDEIILDLIYSPHIRKLLSIDDSTRLSPSQIIIPILISELSLYFQKKGVRVIAFDCILHSELKNQFPRKYSVGKSIEEAMLDESLLEKFCHNDPEDLRYLLAHRNDLNRISKVFYNGIHNELIDYASDGFNIQNGKRCTLGKPVQTQKTIHMFGPCIVEGLCVTDDKTIASILQKNISNMGWKSTEVENYGLAYGKDILNDLMYMASTNVKTGDIILWLNGFSQEEEKLLSENNIPIVDCKDLANTSDEFWYLDNPFHCNYWMNKRYSEKLFNNIIDTNCIKNDSESSSKKLSSNYISDNDVPLKINKDSILNSDELRKYVNWLESQRLNRNADKIGCVVINANPYTLGHRHLIQSALKDVDLLYVIIVEENTGGFLFNERYEMVNSEWSNFPNVKVISGGNVLTSSLGFPEYFNRSRNLHDANPLLNHKIFAQFVTPTLSINVRFFGEENNDAVTRSLNESAISYLPPNGIDVKIIERKEFNGSPISAKVVRSLFSENKFHDLIPLVPFSTYKFLLEKKCDRNDKESLIRDYFYYNIYKLEKPILRNGLNYPGMFHKLGLSIDGENFMLKISQTSNDRLNLMSESIGSRLCKILGIPCSEIRLTEYEEKLSLLSKSWDLNDGQFFPLSSFYEEKIDTQEAPIEYLYETFVEIIRDKCSNEFDDTMLTFWLSFIIDYLQCNARGAGNIGFIYSDKIRLAPIYDNSTCLTSSMDKSYQKDTFPKLPMKFGENYRSSYEVLRSYKDIYKERAVDIFKRKFKLEYILDFITCEEEEYLVGVIKYRYNKLFGND